MTTALNTDNDECEHGFLMKHRCPLCAKQIAATPSPASDSGGGATARPWRISPDSPFVVFSERYHGIAIANTTNSASHQPIRGYLDSGIMLSDEENAIAEQDGWRESRRAEMAANAALIVKAVNGWDDPVALRERIAELAR